MSDNRKSDISALMDGELSSEASARLIKQLCQDPAELETWVRFHLIADALRNDPVLSGGQSIAPAVMAALATEATILSPQRHETLPRRVLTGAIAASVAALAVFTLQGRVTSVESADAPGLAATVTVPAVVQGPAAAVAATTRPADAEDLQRYFMNHNEYRASQPMRPLPPHASLVGFSPQAAEPQPLPAPAGGAAPAR
jgi:negative regulator of sigma E activity